MSTMPPARVPFRVMYLEGDSNAATTFIRAFGQQVSILPFEDPAVALGWLEAGNEADMVIINQALGGLQFLQTLRGHPTLPDLPVVLVSEASTPDVRQKALRLRAADVFPMHVAQETIRQRLDYFIRKKTYLATRPLAPEYAVLRVRVPWWKRILDIAVSLSVLTALSPLLLVVSLLIWLDSPGPVFYHSKRVGAGYRIFDMYKFRSMKLGADQLLSSLSNRNVYASTGSDIDPQTSCETCQRQATSCSRTLFLAGQPLCEEAYLRAKKAKATFMKFREDPRVTRLGRFLRNSSIDELPQLFNILRGDMSLVGNRPLPLYEAEKLTTTGYVQRFAAPAGLTGLWQVMKRAKGQARMSDHERIQLDILYAETFSFQTDFRIMLKTVTALWQKENV